MNTEEKGVTWGPFSSWYSVIVYLFKDMTPLSLRPLHRFLDHPPNCTPHFTQNCIPQTLKSFFPKTFPINLSLSIHHMLLSQPFTSSFSPPLHLTPSCPMWIIVTTFSFCETLVAQNIIIVGNIPIAFPTQHVCIFVARNLLICL